MIENLDSLFRIYDGVFQDLKNHGDTTVIQIDESGLVSPIDDSTKLLFSSIMNSEYCGYSSLHLTNPGDEFLAIDPSCDCQNFPYFFISETDSIWNINKSIMVRKDARKEVLNKPGFKDVKRLYIQSKSPFELQGFTIHSSEALPTLLTMLYFRAKGYAVQAPLRTYEGVDDIAAWKSPFLEKLREHQMIEYGCYIEQLRFLKKSWPVKSKLEKVVVNDFILIEAESCENNAINEGMNQLIGDCWPGHKHDKYKKGAISCQCSTELYISFPYYESDLDAVEYLPRFNTFKKNECSNKVGMLIWTPDKLVFRRSYEFPHNNITEEVKKYEEYAKRLILSNFNSINEVKWLMDTFLVEYSNQPMREAFNNLVIEVVNVDDDFFLSKIEELLEMKKYFHSD